LQTVAIRRVLETVHMSCCQLFPYMVYIDLNLRDTLMYE
jgi:hypothetical protein